MVRPSEEFLLAWSSLTGSADGEGWRAISLSSAGRVEVQAGRRSPDGSEAILLSFPSVRLAPGEKLPEAQGFVVEVADGEAADQLLLALTRRAAGNIDLFAWMACDVVGALDEAASMGATGADALRFFLGRVGAWQEFMRKGSQALGLEAELGLFGELVFLQEMTNAGVSLEGAINSWVGAIDGVQDFALGIGAIEVKTTLSGAGFPARIGSLEQLDDSTLQPLFLCGIRLRHAQTGQTLTEVVAELRRTVSTSPEASRILGERLLAAGYFDGHAAHYVRRLAVIEVRIVEVTDGFPRLTPGRVPRGITRAAYEIDLDQVASGHTTLIDALKRVGVI